MNQAMMDEHDKNRPGQINYLCWDSVDYDALNQTAYVIQPQQ